MDALMKSGRAVTLLLVGLVAGCGGGESQLQKRSSSPAKLAAPKALSTEAPTIPGFRENYTIVKQGSSVTVTNKFDPTDVQHFDSAQLIKFADLWTSFDVDGPAGQVYRMYQAAFNRKPDLPGLGFWIYANQNDPNATMIGIAGGFIGSDEFRRMYGDAPPNPTFVDSLYRNVLHRAGEPEGFNWWVGELNKGADRRGVLFGFSDSEENKRNLRADMINGFDYQPFVPAGATYAFTSCDNDNTGANSKFSNYMVNNNVWNAGTAPYSQCLDAVINETTGVNVKFNWQFSANGQWDGSVKTYPAIAYGHKPAYMFSTAPNMPQVVANATNLFVQGDVVTTCETNCKYDTALDLLFTKTPMTNGFHPSAELMIFTDYTVETCNGESQGVAQIDGKDYKVYAGPITVNNETWDFICYMAVKQTTKLALNMKSFVVDAVKRGVVKPDHYFASVEMGTEVIYGVGSTVIANYKIKN